MKFIDIKKEYLQAIKSHIETKNIFKNSQRSFSKGETDEYPSVYKMESSSYSIRVHHVAYSLLKGNSIFKIEKELNSDINKSAEKMLQEFISKLNIEVEFLRDENGNILEMVRKVSNEV